MPGEFVELDEDFVQQAQLPLAYSTIGFVKISDDDAQIGGSGTLVSIDDSYGILTAAHVLKHLPTAGEVGLVFPVSPQGRPLSPRIDMEYTTRVFVGSATIEREGPDIAFLALAANDVATISAIMSFHNLTKSTPEDGFSMKLGAWSLVGMAHEWTKDLQPERGFSRVKSFNGLAGLGAVDKHYQDNGFDYLEFEAKYDDAYPGPESFEGYSGGGLWQILLQKDKAGQLTVKERRLQGVAFYQEPKIGDIRIIRCHGPKSIYERVVAQVRARI